MIKSTQKVIQIGTSVGVTFPAKELKSQNINLGDEVEVTVKAIDKTDPQAELISEYKKFKQTYGETLKNLADR